jgi:hypothetical protein
VHALQGLLFDGLDAHRAHVRGTGSFQQRGGIGSIGLVAFDLGTNVLGRQQPDFDTQAIEPAAPVMSRAAGFHDDQGYITVGKPALELGAREALGFNHAPVFIGYGELKDGLCKIDGNGSSIHVGLLTLKDLIPIPMTTSKQLLRKKTGESIPSVERDRLQAALAGSIRGFAAAATPHGQR